MDKGFMVSVLSITGLDISCSSGLQQDFKVIADMGAQPLTVASCVAIQEGRGNLSVLGLPHDVLSGQVSGVLHTYCPKAVKVGLLPDVEAVRVISDELCGQENVVIAPGILSSKGIPLVDKDTILAIKEYLVPMASLLVMRCTEVERILHMAIVTDEDMLLAARTLISMGAKYVLLRGGKVFEGRLTALLAGRDGYKFFSSYNIDGWQRHGVGGALAMAIATRLGLEDDVAEAISSAHEYVHSRIVYSVVNEGRKLRPADIYNEFLNLVVSHHSTAHDVFFYADKLNISTRYLSQITSDTVGKTPKQVISDYLLLEARQLLSGSRLSVKEISCKLGFSNVALFCRFFRLRQHQSPNAYRLSVE